MTPPPSGPASTSPYRSYWRSGARQIRQYSLSSSPGSRLRSITVKRVRGEAAVSRHLHEHTRAGDRLRVSVPYGDLVLDHLDAPLLLASAGIGCTPCRCWSTWPSRATTARSPWCTATARPPTTPCAPTTSG
ncbi:Flavohemoprotein [Streptomyces microflavus]